MKAKKETDRVADRIVFSRSATSDRLIARLELRRSSAASKHRNKAKYHRPTERDKKDDDN